MHKQYLMAAVLGALTLAWLSAVRADAVTEALAGYQAQGAGPFSATAGEQRWREDFTDRETGQAINCTSCHTQDLRQPGAHMRTRKPIEPLAPAVNPKRLTDLDTIEKWFLRNCKGTWGRECTPQEKGDFLVYIQSQ